MSWGRHERVVITGDSTDEGNQGLGGAVSWVSGGIMDLIQSNYLRKQGTPDAQGRMVQSTALVDVGSPTYVNTGVSGDKVLDILTNVATLVDQYRPTRIILGGIGTNDTATAIGTLTTQWQNLINHLRNPTNCPFLSTDVDAIIVSGVFLIGDKWPDGANANDAAIDAIQNMFIAQSVGGGGSLSYKFNNIRAKAFAALPTLNPGNTNGGSGLVVDNGSDSSLKHPTPTGAIFWSNAVYPDIPFHVP